MRTIDRASAFKRDYKREAKWKHRATLGEDLRSVLVALATDQPPDAKYRDHDLSGDWAGYRECHIKPDLRKRLGNPPSGGFLVHAGVGLTQFQGRSSWSRLLGQVGSLSSTSHK